MFFFIIFGFMTFFVFTTFFLFTDFFFFIFNFLFNVFLKKLFKFIFFIFKFFTIFRWIFFFVIFGQTYEYFLFNSNHCSFPLSVSRTIASIGHSGSQTPQSIHSSGLITSIFCLHKNSLLDRLLYNPLIYI